MERIDTVALHPTSVVCVGTSHRLLLTCFQNEHRIEDGHYAIQNNNEPPLLMDVTKQ